MFGRANRELDELEVPVDPHVGDARRHPSGDLIGPPLAAPAGVAVREPDEAAASRPEHQPEALAVGVLREAAAEALDVVRRLVVTRRGERLPIDVDELVERPVGGPGRQPLDLEVGHAGQPTHRAFDARVRHAGSTREGTTWPDRTTSSLSRSTSTS